MTKTQYEKEKGLVERNELMKNLTRKKGMLNELNEQDFHYIYSLIWSLTAKELLMKSYQHQIKRLENEIKEVA